MSSRNSNHLVNPNAREAMDKFKMEAASEVDVSQSSYKTKLVVKKKKYYSEHNGSLGAQSTTLLNPRKYTAPLPYCNFIIVVMAREHSVKECSLAIITEINFTVKNISNAVTVAFDAPEYTHIHGREYAPGPGSHSIQA